MSRQVIRNILFKVPLQSMYFCKLLVIQKVFQLSNMFNEYQSHERSNN